MSSPVSFLGTSLASFGQSLITGTGWYNGNWGAINTVFGSGYAIASISGSGITNLSALNGCVVNTPNSFLGNITTIRLSSGICQAVNQI